MVGRWLAPLSLCGIQQAGVNHPSRPDIPPLVIVFLTLVAWCEADTTCLPETILRTRGPSVQAPTRGIGRAIALNFARAALMSHSKLRQEAERLSRSGISGVVGRVVFTRLVECHTWSWGARPHLPDHEIPALEANI